MNKVILSNYFYFKVSFQDFHSFNEAFTSLFQDIPNMFQTHLDISPPKKLTFKNVFTQIPIIEEVYSGGYMYKLHL